MGSDVLPVYIMNINKSIWFCGLVILSANLAIFISRLSLLFPGLKIAYILLVLAAAWFFQSQFNTDFRQAFANTLNLDEGEYVTIIFCILLGILIGGLGVWIGQIL